MRPLPEATPNENCQPTSCSPFVVSPEIRPYCPACLYGHGTLHHLQQRPGLLEGGICPVCGQVYPKVLILA